MWFRNMHLPKSIDKCTASVCLLVPSFPSPSQTSAFSGQLGAHVSNSRCEPLVAESAARSWTEQVDMLPQGMSSRWNRFRPIADPMNLTQSLKSKTSVFCFCYYRNHNRNWNNCTTLKGYYNNCTDLRDLYNFSNGLEFIAKVACNRWTS